MTSPYTTQEERLDYLIGYLQKENASWQRSVPAQYKHDKQQVLRALLNVRPPSPIAPEFIAVQDDFLQMELRHKNITAYTDIPLSSRYPHVGVWRGDITTLAVDAIVNAANSKLLGCFAPCHNCIDNVIHTAAGIQLRQECHEIMQRQQHDEPTGQAKITRGYNLPSSHVLHTVGPIVHDAITPGHKELLASCYRSCFSLAQENGLESLAFCCISTGVFNFPRETAASIALQTVLACLKTIGDCRHDNGNNLYTEDPYRHDPKGSSCNHDAKGAPGNDGGNLAQTENSLLATNEGSRHAGSLKTIIFCVFSEEDYALYTQLLD